MAYKVINGKLGIKSCSVSDLTAKQVNNFLSQWEDGEKIGSLTFFYEKDTGCIVLNHDHENYEDNLFLTETYLSASTEVRKKMLNDSTLAGSKESLQVLQNAVDQRKVKVWLKRIGHLVPEFSDPVLRAIYKEDDDMFRIWKAYQYGVMQGKCQERTRRKQKK